MDPVSKAEIANSMELLQKDWEIDPLLKDFVLGRVADARDYTIWVGGVIFHIPFIESSKKYVLWKCFWPDCHNCCQRQGRLPLTHDDLITIGRGLKYQKTSDFIKNETLVATYKEPGPSGQAAQMTTINLKRKKDEVAADDGTRIPCRFLDQDGGCSMHPARPGVCYLYPFTTWLENEQGRARVHATFQFTGDCPGFYLSDNASEMDQELADYSKIIYDYNMESNRTGREGYGFVSLG